LAGDTSGATNVEAQTIASFTLLALGIVVLGPGAAATHRPAPLLVAAMAVGGVLVWVIPFARHFFDPVSPPANAVLTAVIIVAAAIPILLAAVRATASRRKNSEQ
jgi:hypothetical protein